MLIMFLCPSFLVRSFLLMDKLKLVRSRSSGVDYSRKHLRMLTTLESHVNSHVLLHFGACLQYLCVVPMDLDPKIKAVMLGACFLIVSRVPPIVLLCFLVSD